MTDDPITAMIRRVTGCPDLIGRNGESLRAAIATLVAEQHRAAVSPPDPAGAAGEEARPSDAGKAAALYAAEYHRLRARLAESERTQERAFDAGYRKGFVAGYNHAPQPWAITGVCAMAADAAREYRAALTRETPP